MMFAKTQFWFLWCLHWSGCFVCSLSNNHEWHRPSSVLGQASSSQEDLWSLYCVQSGLVEDFWGLKGKKYSLKISCRNIRRIRNVRWTKSHHITPHHTSHHTRHVTYNILLNSLHHVISHHITSHHTTSHRTNTTKHYTAVQSHHASPKRTHRNIHSTSIPPNVSAFFTFFISNISVKLRPNSFSDSDGRYVYRIVCVR